MKTIKQLAIETKAAHDAIWQRGIKGSDLVVAHFNDDKGLSFSVRYDGEKFITFALVNDEIYIEAHGGANAQQTINSKKALVEFLAQEV